MIMGAISDTAFSKKFNGPGLGLKNFGIPQKNMHLVVLAL